MPSGRRTYLELPLGHILDRLDTIEGVDAEFFLHHRRVILFLLLITLIDVSGRSKVTVNDLRVFLEVTTNGYHIGSIIPKLYFLIVNVIKERTLISSLRHVL